MSFDLSILIHVKIIKRKAPKLLVKFRLYDAKQILVKGLLSNYFNNKSMSDQQYTYINPVYHPLNKSPSKTTYSFARAERFPILKKQEPLQQSCNLLRQSIYSSNSPIKSNNKSKNNHFINESQNYQKSPRSRNQRDFGVGQEVSQILKRINQKNDRKSRSKSPNRSPKRFTGKDNFNETSPSRYRQYQERQYSPKSRQNRSPLKNTYSHSELIQLDHPSKNMTITGYYPVGTEISPEGRYASSRIHNVTGTKMSPLPYFRGLQSQSDESLGPGYYNSFSEFGGRYNR